MGLACRDIDIIRILSENDTRTVVQASLTSAVRSRFPSCDARCVDEDILVLETCSRFDVYIGSEDGPSRGRIGHRSYHRHCAAQIPFAQGGYGATQNDALAPSSRVGGHKGGIDRTGACDCGSRRVDANGDTGAGGSKFTITLRVLLV